MVSFKKKETHGKEKALDVCCAALEITALVAFLFLFIPSVNPARISAKINRNISLFTSGLFYKTFTNTLHVLMKKGWAASAFNMDYAFATLATVATLAMCAGCVLTFGNGKSRRVGSAMAIGGSAFAFAGVLGILRSYRVS